MKKNIAYIMILSFISSCGSTNKNDFQYNKWGGLYTNKLMKKPEKLKKLVIWNYTAEIFPNPTIEKLINIKKLAICSDSLLLDSNTDDRLVIDSKKLSKLEELRELYIGTFSMLEFPEKISNSKLTKLSLSIDQLSRLELNLSELTKLEELNLELKDLVAIDTQLVFPKSLKKITIYSEHLRTIDLRLLSGTQVETIILNIDETPNSELIKVINYLSSIKTLKKIKMTLETCERKEYLLGKIEFSKKVKLRSKDDCKEALIN